MPATGKTQASTASPARLEQMRAPKKLDFEADDLLLKWKRWKEEINWYMNLAMAGKLEEKKVKLFLFLIGTGGREVHETLHFDPAPTIEPLNKQPQTFRRNACRYCEDRHERGNCPAYGKTCSKCNKINHFAAVCLSSQCSRTKQETVTHVQAGYADYSDVESDYDDLNTLELTPELQTNAVTDQQQP